MRRTRRGVAAGAVAALAVGQLIIGVHWAAQPPAVGQDALNHPPVGPLEVHRHAPPPAAVALQPLGPPSSGPLPSPALPPAAPTPIPPRLVPITPPVPHAVVPAVPEPPALPAERAGRPVEIPPVPDGRTAFQFAGPAGMKVSWQLPDGAFHDRDLTAPAAFNFTRGRTYRLRLAGHARYPDRAFYPTLEVPAGTDRARAYLEHCAVPLSFTEAELLAASEGRFVVKVIVLGSSHGDEPVLQEHSSMKDVGLGRNPQQNVPSGSAVVAVLRLGNIQLENPESVPLTAPPGTDLPPRPAIAPLPRAVSVR